MSKVFYILILFLGLTCGCIRSSSRGKVCLCCIKTFTSIDSARYCIEQTPIQETSSDPRLFLIAFVNKDREAKQKAGWSIIKDQEIVNLAKRIQNYLLITLDSKDFIISHGQEAPDIVEEINKQKEEIIFIIANQALVPFSVWTENESKNIIIDRLYVGNGP